jgi:hypothetical protein
MRYREAIAFAVAGTTMVLVGLVLIASELSDRVNDLLITSHQDRTIGDIGALPIVLGALGYLMGAVTGLVVWLRSRRSVPSPSPPGWYRVEHGYERWWDGHEWSTNYRHLAPDGEAGGAIAKGRP